MNSVSCGGQPGVSDSFASALWSLDALFQMARVGVEGVNIHTTPGALDELFTFRHVDGVWEAAVRPEYYGLMMFSAGGTTGLPAAQPVRGTGDTLRDWATLAPDGQTRIAVINTDPGRARRVYVRAARASGSARGRATPGEGVLKHCRW